jgi:DNA-binding MarR family transcriptional regulator
MPIEDERVRAADQVIAVLPILHRTILHSAFAQGGRHAMEYRVLRLLSEHGELRMSGISRCLLISKPYLTAIVDALIAAGHVERRRDAADRRVVRIAVTPSGERHLEEGVSLLRRSLLDRFTVLDEAEVLLLSESLETLARVLARVGADEERPS